jgi:hypothetical protein
LLILYFPGGAALGRATNTHKCSPAKRSAAGFTREKSHPPTIFCHFFSKNELVLTSIFNSFIKYPAPEILHP